MRKEKKKQMGVLGLVLALVVVLMGSVLFVGAVSGWFDDKVVLDTEYYSKDTEFIDLTTDEYEELIRAKKSFIVFVDQNGCTTADRLRDYMKNYMEENGIIVYKMMFSDMKQSSLHEKVKYYPSVAIIDKGAVRVYLDAESDKDAEIYNNYEAFKEWMRDFVVVENFEEKNLK